MEGVVIADTSCLIVLHQIGQIDLLRTLALAVELKDCYLVLDDLRARKVAAGMGLSFTGTLGVIATAKRRGIIPVARPLFEQIRQANFWISGKFLEQILAELGE